MPAAQPTRVACCVLTMPILCLLINVASSFLTESGEGNGPLPLSYGLSLCRNEAQAISIAGRGDFYAYSMRRSSDPIGTACAVTQPTTVEPTVITLEEDDGYRGSSTYHPVFLLPRSSYATISFKLTDAAGDTLLERADIFLGPDQAYPWTSEDAVISGRRRLSTTSGSPTRRRLLKGGSYGGGSSYSGVTRSSGGWGSSTPVSVTRSGSTSRASYTSSNGHVGNYGGRSSYAVGGYSYGAAPYSYRYGARAWSPGITFLIVTRGGYGCYSCYHQTCGACYGCTTRSSCAGGRGEGRLAVDHDRYELDDPIMRVPEGGSPRWPLNLTVFAATGFDNIMQPSATGDSREQQILISFSTPDADTLLDIASVIGSFSLLGLIITGSFCACMHVSPAGRRAMYADGRDDGRPTRQQQQRQQRQQRQQQQQPMPVAVPVAYDRYRYRV